MSVKLTLFKQIVELLEGRRRGTLDYAYYLLNVQAASLGDLTPAVDGMDPPQDLPKAYLRAGHMTKLDRFSCTHGPTSSLYGKVSHQYSVINSKSVALSVAVAYHTAKWPICILCETNKLDMFTQVILAISYQRR